jgi:serralysin
MHDSEKEIRDTEDSIRKHEDAIRATEEKIRLLARDTNAVSDELSKRKLKAQKAQEELQKATSTANSILSNLQDLQDLIKSRAQQVDVFYTQYVARLSPEQAKQLATIDAQQGPTGDLSEPLKKSLHLWPTGSTIHITFLDGDESLRRAVIEIGNEWTQDTGIGFVLGTDTNTSQIRVAFTCSGNWAYLGREALVVPKDKPTMCLGTAKLAYSSGEKTMFKKTVLVEFGHALGLLSEHQNPKAKLLFNMDAVYSYFTKPPLSWDRATVDQNFLTRSIPGYREFDPNSVMMYSFPKEIFANGAQIEGGGDISAGDRLFMQKLYPKGSGSSASGNSAFPPTP